MKFRVVGKYDDGAIAWSVDDFTTEEEAYAYAESQPTKNGWGEEILIFVEQTF